MRAKAPLRARAWAPLLVCLALAAPAGAEDSPVTLAPQDIRESLFGACFTSPTEGWVVGDLGRVYKTRDGGKSWTRFNVSGRRPFFSVSCLDGNRALISTTHARIFHTADGGATWNELVAPGDRNLLTVEFVNDQVGIAVGDFGLLVRTEDGGKTWEELKVPSDFQLPETAVEMGVFPEDVLLYAVSFGDEKTAWISGEFGTILKSEDAGKTWKQQKSGLESTLFGIHFTDASRGIAVGMDSVILSTQDGGETWTPVSSPFQERAYYDVRVSGSNAWIVGGQGTLLVSSDGGKEWRNFPTPIRFASEWFRGLSLVGDQGFIVGGAGLIYATSGADAKLLGKSTADRRADGTS